MYIQLLVILLALLGAIFFSSDTRISSQKRRKYYVIYICIILILQSALRHLAVGADTYAYYLDFEDIKITSWESILYNFYSVYILGEGKDAGYQLLEKAFQVIFPDFRCFLFAIAIAFFYYLGRFLYRNTICVRDVFIAICLYQAIFYDFFSITGLRQTIATIFTFVAYEAAIGKKTAKFVLVLLIAFFMHKSVLIFMPMYLIANIKNSRLMLLCGFCALPIMFIIGKALAGFMVEISGAEAYGHYLENNSETGGASSFILLMVAIGIMSLLGLKKILAIGEHRRMIAIINSVSVAIALTPLTWVDPNMMRVVQYYSIFALLLLPLGLSGIFSSKQRLIRNIAIIIIVVMLCIVIVSRGGEYAFFWQEMQLGENY